MKNRKKRKTKKTRHHGPLRRRERHPRRSIAFCRSEAEGPQGVALLRRGEVLRRSVEVLRRVEVIVHSGQFSDFCF